MNKMSDILAEYIGKVVRGQPGTGWVDDPGYNRRVAQQNEWNDRMAELKQIIDNSIPCWTPDTKKEDA